MFRYILFTITTLGIIQSAYAATCTQLETQYVGQVKEMRTDLHDQNMADCYLKIDFDRDEFKPHGTCPLPIFNIDEVYAGPFACEKYYAKGKTIGGLIIRRQDGFTYLDLR